MQTPLTPVTPRLVRESSKVLLVSLLNHQIELSRAALVFVRKIIKVMSSSRGRDKICGIFQYFFKMVALSAMESNIVAVRADFDAQKLPFHFVALKVWKNLSQARKLFRFLKFVDVVEELMQLTATKSTFFLKTLKLFSKVFSFFYFMLDNAVWFMRTNIFEWPHQLALRLRRTQTGHHRQALLLLFQVRAVRPDLRPRNRDAERVD